MRKKWTLNDRFYYIQKKQKWISRQKERKAKWDKKVKNTVEEVQEEAIKRI